MLLKDILIEEEKNAPEGWVSAGNLVRMNVEGKRRSVLLESASKKGRLFRHPPPDDQSPPRADRAPPFKPKKRPETHQRSSSGSHSNFYDLVPNIVIFYREGSILGANR